MLRPEDDSHVYKKMRRNVGKYNFKWLPSWLFPIHIILYTVKKSYTTDLFKMKIMVRLRLVSQIYISLLHSLPQYPLHSSASNSTVHHSACITLHDQSDCRYSLGLSIRLTVSRVKIDINDNYTYRSDWCQFSLVAVKTTVLSGTLSLGHQDKRGTTIFES